MRVRVCMSMICSTGKQLNTPPMSLELPQTRPDQGVIGGTMRRCPSGVWKHDPLRVRGCPANTPYIHRGGGQRGGKARSVDWQSW